MQGANRHPIAGGAGVKSMLVFVTLVVMTIPAGCKKRDSASPSDPKIVSAASPLSEPAPILSSETNPAGGAFPSYRLPPRADVGLSVEQAYAAIPHRRTVWTESETTVPADQRAYLTAIFGVVDEAIAVRVAGLQNFSQQRFDTADVDGQFERLIWFARNMPVPARLNSYHSQILTALAADRQFFVEWKAQGASFPFAHQLAANGSVQAASAAAHAAYNELMSKYPAESQSNKDAFFDYHCALDFL